jgi:drug/metabolite transporter (DMT)-like permease
MTVLSESKKGILAIACCALLWSTGGIFIKLVSLHPLAIASARSCIASLVIWFFLKKPKFTFSFPQIAGGISNALTMILFVASNKLTTSANAILLQYTAPVFAAFFGWFILSERPSKDNWVALGCTMIGMVLFFFDKLKGFHLLGDVFSIISGITFALTSIFMRMQKEGSPLESLLLAHMITVCIGIPFLVTGPLPGVQDILAIGGLGLFQVGISSILFAYAIKRVSAVQTMLTAGIEPILNPVWVFIFAGEIPGMWALIGGTLIILSVTATSVISARRKSVYP